MGEEKADTVEPKWAVLPRDIASNYPLISPRLEAGRLLPVRGSGHYEEAYEIFKPTPNLILFFFRKDPS